MNCDICKEENRPYGRHLNESVNTASIGDNKRWDQLSHPERQMVAAQVMRIAPNSAYTDILRDEKYREKYDLNYKPCVKCGAMKPTCSLIKSSHLGGLACCDCVNAIDYRKYAGHCAHCGIVLERPHCSGLVVDEDDVCTKCYDEYASGFILI